MFFAGSLYQKKRNSEILVPKGRYPTAQAEAERRPGTNEKKLESCKDDILARGTAS